MSFVTLESCMATVPARHHRFSGSTFCLKFLDKKLTGHSACKPRDCWGLAVGASSTGTAAVGAGGSGGKSSTLFSLLKQSVSWNDTPLQSTDTCFIVFVNFLKGPRLRTFDALVALLLAFAMLTSTWLPKSYIIKPTDKESHLESTALRGKKNLQPSPRFSPVSLVLSPLIPQHGEAFDEILSSRWHRFTLHATTHLNHFIELRL